MTTIDEAILLSFGSGELSASDETELIARSEIEPELWRKAVLAVVEYRRMVAALGDFAETEEPLPLNLHSSAPRRASRMRLLTFCGASLAVGLLLGAVASNSIKNTGYLGGKSEEQIVTATMQAAPESSLTETESPIVLPLHSDEELLAIGDALQTEPLVSPFERLVLNDHGVQVEEVSELYIVETVEGTQWAIPAQRATFNFMK